MKNDRTQAIIRLIVLGVALANTGLQMFGKQAIPIEDNQIAELISLIATISASLWAWWKNNNMTEAALEAQKVLDEIKTH